MEKPSFEQRYTEGNTPWDHDEADHNLVSVVQSLPIKPCRMLDIGCGTGSNAVWLAQAGFDVTAIDLSPTAIDRAKARADRHGLPIHFADGDFLTDMPINGPFGFAFDRGCFHTMDGISQRLRFAERIATLLENDGIWLSLIGNADTPPREVGPPRLTAMEIAQAVEPYFEIQSLSAGYFGGEQEDPPKAWICLMQKRRNQ